MQQLGYRVEKAECVNSGKEIFDVVGVYQSLKNMNFMAFENKEKNTIWIFNKYSTRIIDVEIKNGMVDIFAVVENKPAKIWISFLQGGK